MVANMGEGKKEKMFPAFKVTDEMHATVSRLATKHHRKLMDEVRHLVELGARVEERHAQLLDAAIEGEVKTGIDPNKRQLQRAKGYAVRSGSSKGGGYQ